MSRAAATFRSLLAAAVLVAGSLAQAQVINGKFASGAAGAAPPAPWVVTSYLNKGITLQTPQTLAGLQWMPLGIPLTTVVAGASAQSNADADLGSSASLRWPWTGTRCALVNGGSNNVAPNNGPYNVNVLSQEYTIGPSGVDPWDGLAHLRFVTAPVFQNPEHVAEDEPYCFYEVVNLTKGTVLYSEFQMAGATGYPWKTVNGGLQTELDYTDWKLRDVVLGDIGDRIQLQFVASGCALGGHFGELYVGWVGTEPEALWVSAAPAQSSARPGGNLTYTLTVRNTSAVLQSGAVVDMDTPPGTTFVSATPVPGMILQTPAVGSTGTLTGTFPMPLPPGYSATMTVTVNVNSGPSGPIALANYDVRSSSSALLLGPTVVSPLAVNCGLITSTSVVALGACDQVQYTVITTNSGPGIAYGTCTALALPASSALLGSSVAGSLGAGNVYTSPVSDLPANATSTMVVTVQLGDTNPALAAATASGNFSNLDPGGGRSSATFTPAGPLAITTQPVGAVVLANTPVTLGLAASPHWGATTCQWYLGSAPDTSAPTGSGFSCQVPTASNGTVTYWARVSDGCGTVDSANAAVTVFSTYSLSAAAPGGHGVASPALQAVAPGAPGSVVFTPSAGYHLAAISDNGSSVASFVPVNTSSPYTYVIAAMNADHAVTGTFAPNPFTITLSQSGAGSISGPMSALFGDTPAFTFTPVQGSRVGNVLVDGISVGAPATYTFASIAGPHTLSVVFDSLGADFSVATSGDGNGILTPAYQSVGSGSALTVYITPNRGYQLATLTVDSAAVSVDGDPAVYTFTNILSSHLLSATFTPKLFTVTPLPAVNGTIIPAGPQTVPYGGSVTLTLSPAPGHALLDVQVDGVSVGAQATLTLPAIQADHSVSANFQ